MIVPPKKINYTNDGKLTLGGYLLNDEEFIEPLIIDNPQLASKSVIEKQNIITDMVNNANSVAFSINEEVLDFISSVGFDEEMGARPLKRAIQKEIEDKISDCLLNGNIKNGSNILADIENGEVVFKSMAF